MENPKRPKHFGFLLLQAFYVLVSLPFPMGPLVVVWGTATTGASVFQTVLGYLLTILGVGTVTIAVCLARFTYKSLRIAFFLSILFVVGNLLVLAWSIWSLLSGMYVDSPRQAIIQPTVLIAIGLTTIWFIQGNLKRFVAASS